MKKTLSTLILTAVVVLITATFSFAEYAAAGAGNFPYFHLGALIVGGMTIVSLKQKYEKLYLSEAVGSFAMYAVMVALFTSPVAEAIKNLIVRSVQRVACRTQERRSRSWHRQRSRQDRGRSISHTSL